MDKIRKATNGNYAPGSERFAEEVALMLARRVTPWKSGRPRKPGVDRNGDFLETVVCLIILLRDCEPYGLLCRGIGLIIEAWPRGLDYRGLSLIC